MTMTEVEPVSIEDLDFEPACTAINCDWGRPPATHIGFASCGCSVLFCTMCTTRQRTVIARAKAMECEMSCNICGKLIDPDSIQIEPLP